MTNFMVKLGTVLCVVLTAGVGEAPGAGEGVGVVEGAIETEPVFASGIIVRAERVTTTTVLAAG
jgi:hypothetical protein